MFQVLNPKRDTVFEYFIYWQTSTFEDCPAIVPDESKEIILLRVPLDSPGVCKTSTKDTIGTEADKSQSDNYIGLVTLFVYLLQDSRR